jgi:sarcosine oxidase
VDADVIVVGCGTMGSFALWRLASRGVRVLGFERFEPGHDKGSGHGESRIIRTAYAEGSAYVPLVRSAFALWRQLECETGASLLTMTGGLMIGPSEGWLVKGTLQSARERGLAYEILEGDRFAERYPQHEALKAGEVAVYEEAAGVLRPEAAVEAAARRAEELGAKLLRNTAVESVEESEDGVEVRARGRAYRARRAVVAVGAWLGKLLPELGLPLTVERQVMVWFPAKDPEPFAPGRFPIFAREETGFEWYGLPSLDGSTVKAAVHHRGQAVDPDRIDRQMHPEDVELICRFVGEVLPGLTPKPVRAQVCMYTNTPDEHFLVGPPPGRPNLILLGGFSGHGFKFAPIIGEIAADLSIDGETSHPIAGFSPKRFASKPDM